MSTEAARLDDLSPFEQLGYARDIIRAEAAALDKIAGRLGLEFCRVVDLFVGCRGSVVVSGIGKAGIIAQKISATLASLGTRSFFLHPAEAVHGDLGRIGDGDVVLMLSHSGSTDEIVRLLPSLTERQVPIVAVTSRCESPLGQVAQLVLELGSLAEACPLGLAPSTSTTAMLALGDALALTVSRVRGFGRADFAKFHPAGALGRRLSKVEERMRPLEQCRTAEETQPVRAVFAQERRPGRRTGAIMLTDAEGRLSGLFTDSDLARLFEARSDADFDRPIAEVMTCRPTTIVTGSMLADAVAIMAERKFSELPVIDAAGCPIGLLDVTDLVEMIPEEPR